MKTRNQGGRFLHHDQGSAPKGRNMSPLRYQKGQREEERIFNYTLALDGARVWSF